MDEATASLAHLYRRAGFGATSDELQKVTGQGYEQTISAWVGGLPDPDPAASSISPPELTAVPTSFADLRPGSSARRALARSLHEELPALVQWWLARMVAASNPLTEKLVLLLHNQFPTAVSKVRFPSLMLRQNELMRNVGAGSFDTLTQAVSTDPAMLIWLDAGSDHKAHPNENFARELMERFTMGVGTYTQKDVDAAAACFTGWYFDPATGGFAVRASDHESAPQTFLGQSGINTGQQVIDIATHSEPSAKWVTSRMWSFLAYPIEPSDPVAAQLAGSYQKDLNMSGLLTSIFTHPLFLSAKARTGLVKQPVEWVAGTLRALGFSPADVASGKVAVHEVLGALGQIPFDPPSVGGWPQNEGWLSTASALARWRWATELTNSGAADMSLVEDASAPDRPGAAAELLSVDSWEPPTASALARVSQNPSDVVTLALISPEYVSN